MRDLTNNELFIIARKCKDRGYYVIEHSDNWVVFKVEVYQSYQPTEKWSRFEPMIVIYTDHFRAQEYGDVFWEDFEDIYKKDLGSEKTRYLKFRKEVFNIIDWVVKIKGKNEKTDK